MKRIFFSSDIHGSETCFRKFLGSAKHFQADILVLGGDLTGKMVVPIVLDETSGLYAVQMDGEDLRVGKDELSAIERKIQSNGRYPYVMDQDQFQAIQNHPDAVEGLFDEAMYRCLTRWFKLAEEVLKPAGIPIYAMPGNDDTPVVEQALAEASYVVNAEGAVSDLGGFEMVSCGWANATPWKTPRETTEEDLATRIRAQVELVKDRRAMIFNLHVPPVNTSIDQAPKLDANLKPQTASGEILTIGAGSLAVRDAIEKYQPLVSLHGHIHESRGKVKIGQTMCFNPGSEYGEGILRGLIVNLDERKKKLLSSQFVAG